MTMDAIDELVARSKDHQVLRAFHEAHRANPHILDFLVQEIQLRLDAGFSAFSYHNLWQYSRWKIERDHGPNATFYLNDRATAFYARAITILHPQYNGRCEFRRSMADAVFGTRIEPASKLRVKNYSRRLEWADGTPLTEGWRPTVPHVALLAAATRADIHTR